MSTQNTLAKEFRALHIPGQPLILTNVYDAASARAVAALPSAKALATASYAVASAVGLADEDLTFETNLAAVRTIAPVAKDFKKPLTVDWQDGYGNRLEEGIKALIELGVVGINLEDFDSIAKQFLPIEVAADRIKRVLATAAANGVPDFNINARADPLLHDGQLSDVIERGKVYLAAGATTVFVLGSQARGGVLRDEVAELARAFGGRLNVSVRLGNGNLTVAELKSIGVARISLGPQLQFFAMRALTDAAKKVLEGS